MYATQPQQTPWHLQPVVQAPQPQVPDSLDQASKLIDLIDKLGQRQSGQNLAPGTSQYSPMNAAQFQSANPSQIALQELLLRNPQLIAQLQQSQQQSQVTTQQVSQPQTATEKTYSQQQVAELKSQFDIAAKCANEHFQQLQQLWEVTQNIMSAYNAICNYAQELENAVALGQVANTHANAFLQELNAAYDVLNVQHQMLNTPLYLLTHSFSTFENEIQPTDETAVNLVSDFYLGFVKSFEEKRKSAIGGYSQQYTEYLQNQVSQQHTQPIQQQPQIPQNGIDTVAAWANGLKSQGFGQQIKRAHTQRLLSR